MSVELDLGEICAFASISIEDVATADMATGGSDRHTKGAHVDGK